MKHSLATTKKVNEITAKPAVAKQAKGKSKAVAKEEAKKAKQTKTPAKGKSAHRPKHRR